MQINLLKRKEENKGAFGAFLAWLREFFNSYLFYVFELFAAFMFVVMSKEVYGAIVFAALLSVLLLVCDDVLPTTLPFLLLCTFTTNCYDSFDTFMAYIPYAPIVVACAVFHFVVYHKKFSVGESFKGIFAVSLALCMGGIGNFTVIEYAKGAYYVLGLGFGMMLAYMLMKSEFGVQREYDFKERFAVIMMLEGLLCALMILWGFYRFQRGDDMPYKYGISPNNIATMLLFSMPFPLYLAKKNNLWAIVTPVLFGFLCLCNSRGGMLCGCALFAVCALYWIFSVKDKERLIRFLICAVALVALVVVFGKTVWETVIQRFINEGIMSDDHRGPMIFEAFANFFENPLVGTGILDDDITYGQFNKKGTMTWYHMMIPQIIGSMGLIGIVAYGFQIFGRVKSIFQEPTAWSLCLGLSYLGILLMSQVNPGEFCPLPFELLTVLLFILQEERHDKYALWEKSV